MKVFTAIIFSLFAVPVFSEHRTTSPLTANFVSTLFEIEDGEQNTKAGSYTMGPRLVKAKKVCCSYSCGYTGCKTKWVWDHQCEIIGTVVADSKC